MEATLLRVLLRKLDCGSLRALLTGRAACTHGSMSKTCASLEAIGHPYLASHVCSISEQ
jgi:hypothetical protein